MRLQSEQILVCLLLLKARFSARAKNLLELADANCTASPRLMFLNPTRQFEE